MSIAGSLFSDCLDPLDLPQPFIDSLVHPGNGVRFEWHLLNTHRMTVRANDFSRHMSRLHQ